MEAPRTLIVAPNWVGDSVMALPVLDALGASGRRLGVLARPHLAPLLRLHPAVDRTIERRDGAQESVEALRRCRFDEAVILPNSFRSAWIAYRAGIPRRWGYRTGWRTPLLRPGVRRPRLRPPRHQTLDYRELIRAMGIEQLDWRPRLALDDETLAAGRERLERGGIDLAARPVIGLFPGAQFGPSKRWPRERFVELSRLLRRELPGSRQVLIAGPSEVWLGVRLYELTGKIHPLVGPDLELPGLAGVLAHLDLLVTNDSGPMHLAAALGVPCVSLFGPTDPRRTAPVGEGHRILYTNRWCSPCFRRRCPLIHHRCLRDIGSDEALVAVRSLLERWE